MRIKIKVFLFCFFYHEWIILFNRGSFRNFFFVLAIYFFCFPFFILLGFEPWFFHPIFKRCKNCFCKKDSEIYQIKSKLLKRCNKFISIIYILINVFLIYTMYKSVINNSNEVNTIQSSFNKTKNFTGYSWPKKYNHSSEQLLSSICYTKIHFLNFIQLTALADAAYLKDEINNEINIINAFKKSIFKKKDKDIEIKNMTFLTNKSEPVTILQTDFSITEKKPLTVISIKGTTNILDMWLDIELFISSLFFSIGRAIPLLYKVETYVSNIFNKYNMLSLNYLDVISLTRHYIDNINNIFSELIEKQGYKLNDRNYIFVGHSLGGGLAKYFAFKYNLQGFSVSGPGLTPLEINQSLKKNKTYNTYFKTTLMDLIPDLDIVPRVELSGGNQYRVLCEKGVFECHKITRTLCMLGVMCNKEHLTGDLCHGIFSPKEYETNFIKVKNRKFK